MFSDAINWPEGEDAPPLDSQDLITLLLRQNPLERMGTGEKTKEGKQQAVSYGKPSNLRLDTFTTLPHATKAKLRCKIRRKSTQNAAFNSYLLNTENYGVYFEH